MRGTADECVKDTGKTVPLALFCFLRREIGLLAGVASKGIKEDAAFLLVFSPRPASWHRWGCHVIKGVQVCQG